MRTRILACALFALLAVPVIFVDLGRYSPVNMDELVYHGIARHMVDSGDFTRLHYFGETRPYDAVMNAPIFYWGKAVVIAAVGDGWWSMRILSAAFGLFSCWLLLA